jgi:hypothetical protein
MPTATPEVHAASQGRIREPADVRPSGARS